MNPQDWRQSVIGYIRAEARPEDKYGHQPRLYALACRIGEGMDYDDDVLFAAAWMHDLGVFLGHRPQAPEQLAGWDHVPYTITRTYELLPGWGFPEAKIEAVAEAIRTHQAHEQPTQIEGLLLRDADILEQLGAVGALRAFVKVGRDTRYPTFSSVLPVLRGAADRLPHKLHFVMARQIAVSRVQILEELLAAISIEAGELLH